jgi:hypothetical protein
MTPGGAEEGEDGLDPVSSKLGERRLRWESDPLRRDRPIVAKVAFEPRGTASKVDLDRLAPAGEELDERRRSLRWPLARPANLQRNAVTGLRTFNPKAG